MKRLGLETEHETFRDSVRDFIERELEPHAEKWEADRLVDRSAWVAAGKYGLIGFNMPEEYGGGGVNDFRFNAVIDEERTLAAWHHQRRIDRRARNDRARRWQRRSRHAHVGRARR